MPTSSPSAPGLPALFGRKTHLVGWQGFSSIVPQNWNPARFGGNRQKGDLRLDDEDGPRFELRWEQSGRGVDVAKSVAQFLERLEKEAKKRGEPFEVLTDVRLVSRSRKRKEQVTSFGWQGQAPAEMAENLAAQGFGVAWNCPHCERVTFGHIIGRNSDKRDKIERLSSEIFASLECHGSGGWETWSAFDLKLDVPEEFVLARAQLLLNKLELEWKRPQPAGLQGLGKRADRLVVRRLPIANVLLENQTLDEWAERVLRPGHKTLLLGAPQATIVRGHEALLFEGKTRDLRARLRGWFFDFVGRRRTPPAQIWAWHCPDSNRLWVLETELCPANAHVAGDVQESLGCH